MRAGRDGEEGERRDKEGKRKVGGKEREIRSPDRSCSVVNSTSLCLLPQCILDFFLKLPYLFIQQTQSPHFPTHELSRIVLFSF